MKKRIGSLLNDLNISFDTAKNLLKKSGIRDVGEEYTLNSVVSEKELEVLSSYSHSIKEKTISKKQRKKTKPKPSKKTPQKSVSLKKAMTSGHSFASCATKFNNNQKKIDEFVDLKKELKRIFGNEVAVSKLPLFKTMVIKGIKVNYKYLYYALNGHKVLIKHKCVATWLASIFSEAVNQEKISKADYREIYRAYLSKPIQSSKKKSVRPKSRPWVSIVSVPFGGMNKR